MCVCMYICVCVLWYGLGLVKCASAREVGKNGYIICGYYDRIYFYCQFRTSYIALFVYLIGGEGGNHIILAN